MMRYASAVYSLADLVRSKALPAAFEARRSRVQVLLICFFSAYANVSLRDRTWSASSPFAGFPYVPSRQVFSSLSTHNIACSSVSCQSFAWVSPAAYQNSPCTLKFPFVLIASFIVRRPGIPTLSAQPSCLALVRTALLCSLCSWYFSMLICSYASLSVNLVCCLHC
jgi:hypothetical protein